VVFLGGLTFLAVTLLSDIIGDKAEEVEVPQLVGQQLEDVQRKLLTDYKDFLVHSEGERMSSEYEAGQIIEQRPKYGEKAESGTTIYVIVSSGREMISMPPVENKEYRVLKQQLENEMGLNVEPIYEKHEEIVKDYVIRSEPAPGEQVAKGSTVILYVSLGQVAETVEVSNYVGLMESRLQRELDADKLVKGDVKQVESERPVGEVVWQSIKDGTRVEEKTTIDFHVSMGIATPPPTETPTAAPPTSTPTPATPTPPEKIYRSASIMLPTDGSETVVVAVYVAGVYKAGGTVNTSDGIFMFGVEGYPDDLVVAMIDGEQVFMRAMKDIPS